MCAPIFGRRPRNDLGRGKARRTVNREGMGDSALRPLEPSRPARRSWPSSGPGGRLFDGTARTDTLRSHGPTGPCRRAVSNGGSGSESKHTAPPWTLDWSEDGPLIYAGDLLIASLSGSTEHIEIRGLDEQTTAAKASLMAAAPDLLAALERVLEHGEWLNVYTARGEDAEVVNQARAAIVKAKGQE